MNNITRLTLYAFISSIEIDIRDFLLLNIQEEKINTYISTTTIEKIKKRLPDNLTENLDFNTLITYLDFGDIKQIVDSLLNDLPVCFKNSVKILSNSLETIVPIRNRVMHSRPLEYNDFPTIIDFVNSINNYDFISFNNTKEMQNHIIEDPSYVFGLKIVLPNDIKTDTVLNNLPQPDFDDTGFIGRENDRREIKKRLAGTYPVISIIGEGGIGKTALVLSCLYDLLDDPNQIFEGVIWVSLKTKTLNNGEFVTISNSISTTIDIYKEINGFLDSSFNDTNLLISNILDYLKNFNILLVLDNLETINTQQIRDFLSEIPNNSKVLITSRIGLGEFETRYKLEGLSEKESVYYLKRLAQNNKISDILKANNNKLIEIAKDLYYNPLAMKWFISNLLKGESINSILMHKDNLINFCMSNVYSKLSSDSKQILDTLLICNRECSNAELNFLLGIDSISYGNAMNDLFATNMVYMKNFTKDSENKTLYFITDFSKDYLRKFCKPTNKIFISITNKIKELKGLTENINQDLERDPYKPESIIITSHDEEISAFYLKKALSFSIKRDFVNSDLFIEKAKNATPNYFEVYKISAFINVAKKEYFSAEIDYQTATECKPNYAPLLFLYAGFKLMFIENFPEAYEIICKAEKLDPNNLKILLFKGRILKQMSKYPEADNVFNVLISHIELLDSKSRRILIDQCVDNIKRWIEFNQNNNFNLSESLIKKAIIYLHSLDEKNYDMRIYLTLSDLIQSVTNFYLSSNTKDVTLLIDLLGKYYSKIRVFDDSYFKKPIDLLYAQISQDQRDAIEKILLLNVINVKIKDEGYIFRVGKGFGVIKYSSHSTIYFHWRDFKGDFSNLNIGDKVSFTLGVNDKGACAKNVTLLNI